MDGDVDMGLDDDADDDEEDEDEEFEDEEFEDEEFEDEDDYMASGDVFEEGLIGNIPYDPWKQILLFLPMSEWPHMRLVCRWFNFHIRRVPLGLCVRQKGNDMAYVEEDEEEEGEWDGEAILVQPHAFRQHILSNCATLELVDVNIHAITELLEIVERNECLDRLVIRGDFNFMDGFDPLDAIGPLRQWEVDRVSKISPAYSGKVVVHTTGLLPSGIPEQEDDDDDTTHNGDTDREHYYEYEFGRFGEDGDDEDGDQNMNDRPAVTRRLIRLSLHELVLLNHDAAAITPPRYLPQIVRLVRRATRLQRLRCTGPMHPRTLYGVLEAITSLQHTNNAPSIVLELRNMGYIAINPPPRARTLLLWDTGLSDAYAPADILTLHLRRRVRYTRPLDRIVESWLANLDVENARTKMETFWLDVVPYLNRRTMSWARELVPNLFCKCLCISWLKTHKVDDRYIMQKLPFTKVRRPMGIHLFFAYHFPRASFWKGFRECSRVLASSLSLERGYWWI